MRVKSAEPIAVMPMPQFDQHGNLPADPFDHGTEQSLHHVSLERVHDMFVGEFNDADRREEIWQGWMEHRTELESIGFEYATLVDGSFVTAKEEPGDVDIAVLARPEEVEAVRDADDRDRLRELFTPRESKRLYKCDAYLIPMLSFDHGRFPATVRLLTYWTRVFGIDRHGNHKSFLLVTERGTL